MFLGLLLALAAAAAPATSQHWQAVSNTATSITGDVTFTPSRIVFANGKSLDIRSVSTGSISHASSTPHGTAKGFQLYEVLTKGNPKLLHGNVLCDEGATYLSVAVSPEHSGPTTVFVNVSNGEAAPRSWDSNELCASFTYELKR
jgi:hypothetical protein